MPDLTDQLQSLEGRYRVLRPIGRGGMATVFLAEDLKHDRLVALKVMRPEVTQTLAAERFLREIRISARLNHPNILTLIDSGEAGGLLYYVMPYVEGESLRDRLTRDRHLPLDEALRIARDTGQALAYAHAMGIVHRDVKPENILLRADHAAVADFGIASAVSDAAGERLTETGLSLGTPAYISPEQAAGTHEADGRSDLYSLACVLYEALAGEPPFLGTTPMAVLARKMVEPAPAVRVLRDTVPGHVDAAIGRALARVPEDRFSTVGDFLDALGDTDFSDTPPQAAPSRLRTGWLTLLVASVAVVAVGLALMNRRPVALRATYQQSTADPGVEWFPSLSPDGQWVAYSGDASGNRDIYLKSVGGQNAINLTPNTPEDDDHPAFSPDGERIAFRSERDGGGIFVMGRTGEATRRVTRSGFSPSWSPDGASLVYAGERVELNPQNSEGGDGLWVVEVASGDTRHLLSADAALPSWSPNGHRIAFTRRLADPAQADIVTIAADGGEVVPVTLDPATDWCSSWSPDGRYLYFSSNRSGSMNLWRVRIDEQTGKTLADPEPITTPATSLAHISVAADGRHIAYSSVLFSINIQKATLDPSTFAVTGSQTWVTTGSRRWSSPDPSPDGAWVAFYSLTQPEGDVFVARPDGTDLRQVTGDTAIDRVPRWSPDGQWLAFFSNRDGPLHTWKIRPDGSGLARLSDGPAHGIIAWSPDGRRAVVGTGHQGAMLIDPDTPWASQHVDTLPAPPAALGGFRTNAWSPDGSTLAGDIGFLDKGIVLYSFRSRDFERITDVGEWPVWFPDGRRILFLSPGTNSFRVVDRVSKEVRTIFTVPRDVLGPPRLTADGRTMYYSRRTTESDVWVLTLP